MTIDREHLHVVARDRHLVHGAARAAAVDYGRVTAEIALAVTGSPADLERKRAAILAHASQVGPEDVPADTFAAPTATSGTAAPAPRACSTASATPTSSPSERRRLTVAVLKSPSVGDRARRLALVAAPTADPAASGRVRRGRGAPGGPS